MKNYACILCDYIYEPNAGDASQGIIPGTAFDDLPENWECPECGASKDKFYLDE